MRDEAEFQAYRYFLIPNKQRSLFSEDDIDEKNVIIQEFLDSLKEKRQEYSLNNQSHILYLVGEVYRDLYLLKFAIEKSVTIHEAENNDIKNIKEPDYPYIYVFVDLEHQIILFEKKTSVLRRTATAANKLQNCIRKELEGYDFSLELEKITYERTFWDYVSQADSIYELDLSLNAPNLFNAGMEAEEVLQVVNDNLNNTRSEFRFENDEGNLQLEEDQIGSYIIYASSGGGSWTVRVEIDGEPKKLKSKEEGNTKSINLPKNLEERLEEGIGEMVKEKVDDVDEII